MCLNPYDYLKSEYTRLNSRNDNVSGNWLDNFDKLKDLYESNSLYESDRELFAKLQDMNSQLNIPIDEQDRSTYAIVKRLSENVVQIMNENNVQIPNDIVLGTLPTSDFNAFVCPFDDGQLLVVLNEGLLGFVYLMGRIVSSFISKKTMDNKDTSETYDVDNNTIKENLVNYKEGHWRFIEIFILYFINKNMWGSKTYIEKDNNLSLSGILWDNAELFIVAHEYSHIVLDHLSNNTLNFKKEYLDINSKLYKVIRDWHQEVSADNLALQTVLAYSQKVGHGFYGGYLGVELALACLDVMEKALDIGFSQTHPSAKIRKQQIRKALKEMLPEQYETIVNGSMFIDEIVSYLWETNQERIKHLCKVLKS